LKHLLVYCYFCPDAVFRGGGVQQIIGPLLSALAQSFSWNVSVAHTGPCEAPLRHIILPNSTEAKQPDAVNPDILVESAQQLLEIAKDCDVVLSVDRELPCLIPRPCVLMSNTLCYQTEAAAIQANQWNSIVVPTDAFARFVRALNESVQIRVMPYGLPEAVFQIAAVSVRRDPYPLVVRLPHRPDPRKGHREAIEGLARALPESRNVRLEISWLDEDRYKTYRSQIMDLSRELGVASQVSFSGWLNGNERWNATMNSSAVLQLGRFEETFGLSLVESILFGRCAVTRHQPAVREIVGATPLLIEIGDPLDWYSAVQNQRSNELWSAGVEVREFLSRKLSLQRMVEGYDSVLTEAVTMVKKGMQ